MAKALRDLLDANEPDFTIGLRQLEKTVGHSAIDARLIGDIIQKARHVMDKLSLDIDDSTALELYNALSAAVPSGMIEELLEETDYVLFAVGDDVISFNMIDVIENAHHHLPFQNRTMSHARRSLMGEIVERYQTHPTANPATVRHYAVAAGIINDDERQHDTLHNQPREELTSMSTHNPSILAIGDIFTDAFIELNQESARIDDNGDGDKRLSLPFGQKPPYNRVDIVKSVGPSPNAAVSCARLGLRVSLLAWLGDDQTAQESRQHLQGERIDTALLQYKPNTPSNYYYVLRYGADRTILVKNEDYDYAWVAPSEQPDWIYLSLIDEKSWQLHEDLLMYLDKYPDVKLAFQPGTFHFRWGVERLRAVYARSEMVLMNREEAVQVTGREYGSPAGLLRGLHELGPRIAVVTDGADGAYASDGQAMWRMPNYPDPAPPFERTGAGDAFASTITAALAIGESLETALRWAPINSMSVVQKLGAQAGLLNKQQILEYLEQAPDWYHPEQHHEEQS